MKRVALIEGFMADFGKYDIALIGNIIEYKETDDNGDEVMKENFTTYGYHQTMGFLLNRLAREITKSKLKKFQELHEYVEIARETKEIIEKMSNSLDF